MWYLPPFSLIRDFEKQNTNGNVSKISVNLTCYRHVGSKSTSHSPLAWRRECQKVTLVAVIGWFRSDLSITHKIDGNFGNVSTGGFCFPKTRINENGGKVTKKHYPVLLLLEFASFSRYNTCQKKTQLFLAVKSSLSLGQRHFAFCQVTTVFVDTRLWKTKHPRKRFQNFCQSNVLSTDRIEIHQSQPLVWPSDHLYVMIAGCDWRISIRHVDNT